MLWISTGTEMISAHNFFNADKNVQKCQLYLLFFSAYTHQIWRAEVGNWSKVGDLLNLCCYRWQLKIQSNFMINESKHDKSNKMTCAPSEYPDLPGLSVQYGLSSLCVLYVNLLQAIRLSRCPGWSESLMGVQVILLFCHAPVHFSLLHAEVSYILTRG